MSLPRAFIFDLDGVVVNTVDLHYRAWKHLFDDLGIPFTRRDMDKMRGVHRRDIILKYTSGLNEAQIAACMVQKDTLYKRALAEASREIAHAPVVELIHEAKRRGVRVGLASSSVNARIVLDRVGLLSIFDALADGNTVSRSKPAPDIFVWVAGALGRESGGRGRVRGWQRGHRGGANRRDVRRRAGRRDGSSIGFAAAPEPKHERSPLRDGRRALPPPSPAANRQRLRFPYNIG
jgi:beta-phosphoglucomutase-like phosphatase (HAD superfamily)